MLTDRIDRDILVDAPQHVVWHVITQPDQIARWFADSAELELRPGGAGSFVFDQRATHQRTSVPLVVQSVEPQNRFAFRWAHPPGSEPHEGNSLLVEFTLTPEGRNTRLSLLESGFTRLDKPDPEKIRYVEDHNQGWDEHLANLQAYAARCFTTTLVVDRTPEEVFAAINNVRGWWSGEIDGTTDELDAEFAYRVGEVHYSRQKIVELVPAEKIVWRVLEANLNFTKDPAEWTGTDITFDITRRGTQTEVRFAHLGLVPEFECFDVCSNAWSLLVNSNLRKLITTGEVQPSPFAASGS